MNDVIDLSVQETDMIVGSEGMCITNHAYLEVNE